MKQKKFYIESLGCKVNKYESDGIAAQLEGQGHLRVDKNMPADICIVNTCAVTSKAGMQSRQATRRLIREHPDAVILVTGCHAQTDPDQFKKIAGVDHIVCHQDKPLISRFLDENDCLCPSFEFRKPQFTKSEAFIGFDQPVSGKMTRVYLKIQDGCNQFCSYCIIPYARGASVSMPVDQVLAHVSGLSRKGFSEIILTGIHTGLYGVDLHPATSLTELVEILDKKQLAEQIRISSIEPNEITDSLIQIARPGHILCDHFHIPLQAGDNDVLKKMKRPYTVEQFTEVIHKIHEDLPWAGIGLDVIVGFPGETETAFENSYRLIENLPVSYLHVFPFSPRKGTPAWHFASKVPASVARQRASKMRALGEYKRQAFIRANQGRTLQGVIQHQRDRDTGQLKAVTSNYLTVLINEDSCSSDQNPELLKGKTIHLVYDQFDKNCTIRGRIII